MKGVNGQTELTHSARVSLQDDRRFTKVTLTNVGSQKATFCLVHQASRQWWGQPNGFDAGLPDWLDAFPLHGCLDPQVCCPSPAARH